MKFLCKAWAKIMLPTTVVFVMVGFSAFNARKTCDEIIQAENLPPPRYSTRFVLYPEHDMEGVSKAGFNPGWVVTYAPESMEYGVAFNVTLFGEIRGRGTPNIVARRQKQDQVGTQEFREWFAQVDAKVREGSTFSNVVSILGKPCVADTNNDGTFSAYYEYLPRVKIPGALLTNGFSLVVSNGTVVRKGYSCIQ